MKKICRLLAVILCATLLFTACKKNDTPGTEQNGSINGKITGITNHVAGSKGFVESRDGHFVVDDERIRFFGINLCVENTFPEKKVAEQIAEDLARYGVNCVRMHHMDWPTDKGVFEDFRDNTIELNEENLEKMDYLVYQLQQKGIYINFNTHVSRQYAKNDGMPEYEDVNFAGKYINYFDEKAMELQKDYIQKFYTRTNQYTGKKYTEDPGVAMVEITNENWMYLGWTEGKLHEMEKPSATDKATWPIPKTYVKELDKQFNEWLMKKYGSTSKLIEAWTDSRFDKSVFDEIGELKGLGKTQTLEQGTVIRIKWKAKDDYAPQVLRDNAEFYATLESEYNKEMLKYMKETIGIKVPITTTNGYFGNPSLYAQSVGDFTDTHFYVDTLGDKWKTFEMDNISVIQKNFDAKNVYTAQDNIIAAPALSKIKGKPMTISEFNMPYPSIYEYEGLPFLTSYALYQDWDGIFPFAYGAVNENEIGAMITLDSSLDLVHNPMKMSQIAMCAQMFIRGDIKPADEVITAKYGVNELYSMLNTGKPWAYNNGWTWSFDLNGNFPVNAVFKYRFEKEFYDGQTSAPQNLFKNGDYNSFFETEKIEGSNNELTYLYTDKDNFVTVNTSMSKGAVGYLKGKEISVDGLSFKFDANGSVFVTSQTEAAISNSKDLFINLAFNQENMGQIKNDKGGVDPGNWGTAPVLQHKIVGNMKIATELKGEVTAYTVDRLGQKAADIPAQINNGFIEINLDGIRTNMIMIEVK